MGKVTGFLESTGRSRSISRPATASAITGSSRSRSEERDVAKQAARCMDCGIPYLPRPDRLPGQQPDPGLERPRLLRRLGGGAAQPALDQQLPGIHRPHLPGALRGSLHAQPREHAGHHQDDRAGDRRQGLGRRAGSCPSRRKAQHRQDASPSSAPARPASRPRSSSPASAMRCMSMSARPGPAACCATAFPTSRWRSTISTAASRQMEAEGVTFHYNVNVGVDAVLRRRSRPSTTPCC